MALLQNVIGRGTHAARPAAGSAGLIWFESDTGQLFRDSGSSWQLIDASSLFATKGDLLVGTGSGTVAKLAAGTDTYVLTADSSQTDGIKWAAAGGASLTTASTQLGSNTALTGTTFQDILSLSLAAGTWLVWAHATVIHGSTSDATIQIYDGTTVQAATSMSNENTFVSALGCASPPIVLGSTTTIKLRVANVNGGSVHAAGQNSSSGNNATTLVALKVA